MLTGVIPLHQNYQRPGTPCFHVQVVNEGPIKNQSAPHSLGDSCLRKDTNLKSAAACTAETQAYSHKPFHTYYCRFCPQTSAI